MSEMNSVRAKQEARRVADRRLRNSHPYEWQQYMDEEHEARGVVWVRRLTPEERAERDAEQARESALKKIQDLASQAGLSVTVQ